MERISADTQERRRHIRALLDVHRLEFQRGYWAGTWNRVVLVAFFLLLQKLLFRMFVSFVGFGINSKDVELEAGVGEPHDWTGVIPVYTSGLQSCLIVLAGAGLVLCLLACAIDFGDRRLSLFPLDMRAMVDAEFRRLALPLALFMAPGMVYAFTRYCWSLVVLLSGAVAKSRIPLRVFKTVITGVLFAVLFFIVVLLAGVLLGILAAWLVHGLRQGMQPVRIDPMMVAGIATIMAVLLGSNLVTWWTQHRDSMDGIRWFPFIGSVVVRGVCGIGRVEVNAGVTLRCLLQLIAAIGVGWVLYALARKFLAPALFGPVNVRGSIHHQKAARVVRSAFHGRLSMFTKDLRTFFRNSSAAAGIARWSMVWILVSMVFFGTSNNNTPPILRQYWSTVLGMRVNWAGLFLLMPLEAIVPFFLFYLLLSEEKTVLLANTVPAHLHRMIWDKQRVSLIFGGSLLVLWMLLFTRSPFRVWSPLLLFLCLGSAYIWLNALVCLLAPLWVQRDQDAGIIRSVYATPCMLAVVYLLYVRFGGSSLPDSVNALGLGNAVPVLRPLVISFVAGCIILRFVAAPLSAVILRKRLEPLSAAQEAEASGVAV